MLSLDNILFAVCQPFHSFFANLFICANLKSMIMVDSSALPADDILFTVPTYDIPFATMPSQMVPPTKPPLTDASHMRILEQTLEVESRKATFTCGGSIPIILEPRTTSSGELTPRTSKKVEDQCIVTRPLSLRFSQAGAGTMITFPPTDPEHADLSYLISHGSPATFGRGGDDVYDEQYRKAVAMNSSDFMTDFCPYKTGIVDVVTQLLLPGVIPQRPLGNNARTGDDSHARQKLFEERMLKRGVRAELYKLNVYSGPSGLFKPHVDTPRSSQQIGSLVVSLPSAFDGGQLAVRHQGIEMVHDWSSNPEASEPAIKWAAFYSDC